MIWNENIECMSREQMREVQSIRLRKMADYVYHNTPFYRKRFQEMGLEIRFRFQEEGFWKMSSCFFLPSSSSS